MGLVFMKFGNLGGYKLLPTHVFFAYLFAISEILSDPHNFDF